MNRLLAGTPGVPASNFSLETGIGMSPESHLTDPQPLKVTQKTHWPSVVQFGLSAIAIASFWSLALLSALVGLVELASGTFTQTNGLQLLLFAAGIFFSGLLLVPSAAYSLGRILGYEIKSPARLSQALRPSRLIFILPIVMLIGYWISGQPNLDWLLLPPLHVLAIGLPILWLVYIAIHELPAGSPQRAWGVFGAGIVIAPGLTFIIEVAALIVVVVLGIVAISATPGLTEELTSLVERLGPTSPSPEIVAEALAPYLSNPMVIFTVFTFATVLVPLIEELIKPVGAWLLVGYNPAPVEGFVAGVLSGAGYALVESLALASPGQTWAAIVFARIGTGVIHIFTAGLMGWALALAWQENRYLRLGVTYLVAVLIHGLWNGLTLVTVGTTLSEIHVSYTNTNLLTQLGDFAPGALIVLAVGSFTGLLWANRSFRQTRKRLPNEVEVVV